MRLLFRRRYGNGESGIAFGLRLAAAFLVSISLAGIGGYLLMGHELRRSQIENYERDQTADAQTIEIYGAQASSPAAARTRIDGLLDAIGRRPGTLETLLIDQHHVIREAGVDSQVGHIESDPRVIAALERGQRYAGHEQDPALDHGNFEFIVPVNLPNGRYAYEITFDHRAVDAQLAKLKRILLLVGSALLLGGGVIFFLVGGRPLLRDHRRALQRATRDGLTDLPNQRAFQEDFETAVSAVIRHQGSLALAVLDIDDFKHLNDRYGHPHGDEILKRVATVLRDGRPSDRGYRIGGDEFAVLLPQTDVEGARVLAQRITQNMSDAGIEVSLGLSTLRPGQSSDTLQAEADAALYEVKRRGGGRFIDFDQIRGQVTITGSDKRQAVRQLVEERRLTTVFQPIWNLSENRMIGVEALSRPDPSYGLSGPAEAFDIAEQIGLVHELDVICATQALATVPDLPRDVLFFLNLCPQTLDIDSDGNNWLGEQIDLSALAPDGIVIEITERFGGRTASVVKSLEGLRAQGFKLALDDVGTGNSGLEILRKVHPEYVKLDSSIVTAAETEPGARAVLLAIASFAHQTDAFVIAEGIEDGTTLEFLHTLDSSDVWPGRVIQGGQGFHLGKPDQIIPETSGGWLRTLPSPSAS